MPEARGLLEAVERPIAEVHVHAWITCREGLGACGFVQLRTRETKLVNANCHFHWHETQDFSHSVGNIQQNQENEGGLK